MDNSAEQILEQELIARITNSDLLMKIFEKAQHLELDHYYIGAGCIVQTVWNQLTNRDMNYGIEDIDIVYFNGMDLSIEAEDEVIQTGKDIFSDIPYKIDIKNQARVHLWYGDKFGFEIEPYQSVEDGICSWPTTATSLGVRLEKNNIWKVYAPFGLSDLFNLTVRANKRLITEQIFMKKANKWKSKWPELIVHSWST
ncbi:hypothetical protein SAMN04488542_11760 [Fontibacillus panacisegetis]|uniref:Nucleotidyltransferase family protein n=2 Tax=Fontibacillus TaxID=995014 RepID=A0A1G7P1I2_9BACL|nr:nucleotidyltransferase family protein [Fontibacillus panacisegetis]SDF79479.1 hypothetical protein SAMN04488542_11760 [Fontibacillus panacisegetis]